MAVSVQSSTSTSVTIQPTAVSAPITVTSPNNSSIAINQGGSSPAGLVIRKSTGGTLNSLGDVVTAAIEDGYIIVYDSETNKWVSQSVASAITSVDGGYY